MKKIFWTVALVFAGLGGFAQEVYVCEKIVPETFCAVTKYGHHYMKRDGVKDDKDVVLANGDIVHSEGVLETKDHFITIPSDRCMLMERKVVVITEEPPVTNK